MQALSSDVHSHCKSWPCIRNRPVPSIIKSLCRNSPQHPGSLDYGNGPTIDLTVGLSQKPGHISRNRQPKCQQHIAIQRNKQLQRFLLFCVHVPDDAPHCSSDLRQAAPPVVTWSPFTHPTAHFSDPTLHLETDAQIQQCATISVYCLLHPLSYLLR